MLDKEKAQELYDKVENFLEERKRNSDRRADEVSVDDERRVNDRRRAESDQDAN